MRAIVITEPGGPEVLQIRELPAPQKPGDKAALTFLTRFSLPVFLLPARPALRAEIAGTAVRGRG